MAPIPKVTRKRSAGVSLLSNDPKKQKVEKSGRLTTTIERVEEEDSHRKNVSVIKYAPKKPFEVIDISDDEEPEKAIEVITIADEEPIEVISNPDEESASSDNNESNQFVNWRLVEELEPVEIQKFRRIEKHASFEVIHNIFKSSNLMEYQKQIDDSYEAAIRHLIDGHQGYDYFSAKIEHESLKSSIYLRPEKIENFDKTRFLNKVFMVSQSDDGFLLNGSLEVKVVITKKMVGSGRSTKAPKTYEQDRINKKSIVVIKNDGM